MKLHRTLLWICLLSLLMNTIPVAALSPSHADLQVTSADIWGMTAANPQRTFWVSGASNEVRGNLQKVMVTRGLAAYIIVRAKNLSMP